MSIFLAIFAIVSLCIYQLIRKKKKKRQVANSSPVSPPPSPSNSYTPSLPNTVIVNHAADGIKTVYNPCYWKDISTSCDSDYQIPQYVRSLDSGGFSRSQFV